MFHHRSLNHKINRFHERCLRVTYNDDHSYYKELSNLDNFVSIHHKNLKILALEMFRVYTGLATDTLNDVFPLKLPLNYNLRNQQEFTKRPIKIVHYGVNSLVCLGPRIWGLLPNNSKIL